MANENTINFKLSEVEKQRAFLEDMLMQYWENIFTRIYEIKRRNGEPLTSLSDGLDSVQFMKTLYEEGKGLFFKDKNKGIMFLPCAYTNNFNVYFKPTRYRALGYNYNEEYDLDNSVLVKLNGLATPIKYIVDFYVKKLVDIEITKDLHRNAHKTPIILETTSTTELSARNIFKKINAGEPVIFKNKSKGEYDNAVQVLNANVPYINDKLEDDYHNYEARILTLFGLDNYVEDKAERVQSAEVESQQEYIISSFRVSLKQIQEGLDSINKMFGLDLYIDYVRDSEIEDSGKLGANVENSDTKEVEDNE